MKYLSGCLFSVIFSVVFFINIFGTHSIWDIIIDFFYGETRIDYNFAERDDPNLLLNFQIENNHPYTMDDVKVVLEYNCIKFWKSSPFQEYISLKNEENRIQGFGEAIFYFDKKLTRKVYEMTGINFYELLFDKTHGKQDFADICFQNHDNVNNFICIKSKERDLEKYYPIGYIIKNKNIFFIDKGGKMKKYFLNQFIKEDVLLYEEGCEVVTSLSYKYNKFWGKQIASTTIDDLTFKTEPYVAKDTYEKDDFKITQSFIDLCVNNCSECTKYYPYIINLLNLDYPYKRTSEYKDSNTDLCIKWFCEKIKKNYSGDNILCSDEFNVN